MNKEQRAPWEALASAILDEGWSLCHFCRYTESNAESLCDDSGWMTCKHPLDAISEYGPGEDCFTAHCWGFRPEKGMKLNLAADIVGILLQGYVPSHWVDGKLPTEKQIRLYSRLVAIGELTPWRPSEK